ncbi:hypothetical protein [Haloactinopolyspora sp.]|uniref:hypothetical protein n=1 Tax=Haloactinopolyspora sp. TaxID=1966353 RepID=UPI002631542C|nr:hypothetical protein [Haloactinopolyspora sp.]
MTTRKSLKRGLVAICATLMLAVSSHGVAVAGYGDGESDDGDNSVEGTVEQTITIDGDVVPGGTDTITVSVPAKCWWSAFPGDEKEFAGVWMVYVGLIPLSALFMPTLDEVNEAIEKDKKTPGQWYMGECVEDATAADYTKYLGACQTWFPDACIPKWFGWYEESRGEPPTIIQPEELALAAQALIEIPEPQVEQNPKLAGTDNTTLVNLDTAFWVTDPAAVGGDDGVHELRATIPETGVWVEVRAETDGLQIASPVGSTTCAPHEALTAWEPGQDPACAVAFNRASTHYPGGFPVTVSSAWTTSWRGGIGGAETDSGALDPITTDTTVNISVAEVQSVVTD